MSDYIEKICILKIIMRKNYFNDLFSNEIYPNHYINKYLK